MRKCWCGGDTDVNVCVESEFHDPFSTGVPEKVTRLYVAGPMTGYADSNYPAFMGVAEKLRGAGFHVENPAECLLPSKWGHYIDFLREDLRMLLDCHGVAVLDKWWESTGARNEVQVAGVLKMPVRPWAEWMDLAL